MTHQLMTRANFANYAIRLSLAAAVTVSASCSDLATAGRSPVYLMIDSLDLLTTPPGQSDVQVLVGTQDTTGTDLGRATIVSELKNERTSTTQTGLTVFVPTGPTAANSVTINRYRVTFRRADGRNTPGIDVPYGFDGAATATVPQGGSATIDFELVRRTNKQEPPLRNLINGGGQIRINTIAEVTFYGRDQAGHEVSVTGMISVTFGDF